MAEFTQQGRVEAGLPNYSDAARPAMPTQPGVENGDFGGGNGYGFWGWSTTSKRWVWTDTSGTAGHIATQQRLAKEGGYKYDPATSGENFNIGATFNTAYNTGPDANTRAREAGAQPGAVNPFGNEMMGMQQTYTPFGLQDRSAFGGFGGGSRSTPSYLSEQLVPSLEQRRMGMFSQMFMPQGGK